MFNQICVARVSAPWHLIKGLKVNFLVLTIVAIMCKMTCGTPVATFLLNKVVNLRLDFMS